MEEIKIFRLTDIESAPLAAAPSKEGGYMKRIIFPDNVDTKGVIFGFSEIDPGHSPHRWHNHKADKGPGFEIVYPQNFEEVYYIISGSGTIQWKTEEGNIEERKVGAGDTIFFPADVGEHQLLNTGTEKITMVYCGSPIVSPKVSLYSKSS